MVMLGVGLALAAAPLPSITIRDLVEITDISSLSISPDGRQLAFRTERPSVASNRIATQWWVIPLDGRQLPRPVADGGEALTTGAGVVSSEPATWLADSSGILFRAGINGEVQVWRADIKIGRAVRVTHDPGDVRDFALVGGGQSIRYSTGATRLAIAAEEQRLREQGGRVDPSVDLTVGLVGGARRFGTSRSVRLGSHWFTRQDLLDEEPLRLVEQPLSGGEAASASASSLPAPEIRPDAKATRDRFCAQVDCKRDALRIEGLIAAPALGGTLVTSTNRAQQQSIWLLREYGAKRLISATGLLSGSRESGDPCVLGGRMAYCVETAADLPPRLVRVDLERATVTPLFSPNSTLQAKSAGTARLLRWSDTEGNQFTGQLLLPRSRKPASGYPMVLHYYWCDGYIRGGTGDELPMRPMMAQGIASLCVNRSAVHREKQDSIADYKVARSGLDSIIDRLAKQGIVDPTRIGMQGLSFGSEVTTWMITRTHRLAAAALATGQIEPTVYWFEIGKGRDTAKLLESTWGLGDPDATAADWRRVSTAEDAGRVQTPLLMQLPESEARWSIELSAKLARSSTPFELYVFPDAPHIKYEPRQKLSAYERNLAWFTYWLTGKSVIDPADPGRIDRWRGMAAATDGAKGR